MYQDGLNLKKKKTCSTIPSARKDVEQQELSRIIGGKVKWYSHLGKQFGIFL